MAYLFHILIMINIYTILTVSTNLLVGMTNIFSIGQAAFYGIGAYITVLSLMVWKLPLLPTLALAFIITALSSLLIAYPALRLKADYLVLATLGFQLIVFAVLYNWVSVTRGPYGISGIPTPKLLGIISLDGVLPFWIFSSALTAGIVFIFYQLIRSPFGRVLNGIRENEIAVLSLGRNIHRFKIETFMISGAFAGVAGTLYAIYFTYIDPTGFSLDESIFILAALLIGGTGNLKGPIAGAIFMIVLPEGLRFIGFPDAIAANLKQIVYGLTLIVLMRYRPQGLAGRHQIK